MLIISLNERPIGDWSFHMESLDEGMGLQLDRRDRLVSLHLLLSAASTCSGDDELHSEMCPDLTFRPIPRKLALLLNSLLARRETGNAADLAWVGWREASTPHLDEWLVMPRLPGLVEAAHSDLEPVRRIARDVLAGIGVDPEQPAHGLVQKVLASDDPPGDPGRGLWLLGPPGIAALREALSDPRARARARVASILAHMGGAAREALPALQRIADTPADERDPDGEVARDEAWEAIHRIEVDLLQEREPAAGPR